MTGRLRITRRPMLTLPPRQRLRTLRGGCSGLRALSQALLPSRSSRQLRDTLLTPPTRFPGSAGTCMVAASRAGRDCELLHSLTHGVRHVMLPGAYFALFEMRCFIVCCASLTSSSAVICSFSSASESAPCHATQMSAAHALMQTWLRISFSLSSRSLFSSRIFLSARAFLTSFSCHR